MAKRVLTEAQKEHKRQYERAWYAKQGKPSRIAANMAWSAKSCDRFKELKNTLKCSRCSEDDPVCLDFHHTDPTKKDWSVSNASIRWCWERLLLEIAKCEVLCSNCHRKEHARIKARLAQG